jgi:V/A-type H+-transporting ATPase subunit F
VSRNLSRPNAPVSGKIAVVGERELVLGYRLLGVDETFSVTKEDAQSTLLDLLTSGKYGLIVVSDNVRRFISNTLKERLESSIVPLVLFLPPIGKENVEESLSSLAKRVLGVDLKISG